MVTEIEHSSSEDILHSGFSYGPAMMYTSAGVNRRPECVACSLATGLVYFASHNGILIYDPASTRCLRCNTFTAIQCNATVTALNNFTAQCCITNKGNNYMSEYSMSQTT